MTGYRDLLALYDQLASSSNIIITAKGLLLDDGGGKPSAEESRVRVAIGVSGGTSQLQDAWAHSQAGRIARDDISLTLLQDMGERGQNAGFACPASVLPASCQLEFLAHAVATFPALEYVALSLHATSDGGNAGDGDDDAATAATREVARLRALARSALESDPLPAPPRQVLFAAPVPGRRPFALLLFSYDVASVLARNKEHLRVSSDSFSAFAALRQWAEGFGGRAVPLAGA